MRNFFIKTTFGLLACLTFLTCHNTVKAEEEFNSNEVVQEVVLHRDDLNHWIQVSSPFTSLAVKSENKINLSVIFSPNIPEEREIIFEEDAYSELMFTNPTNSFLISGNVSSDWKENITVYLFDTRQTTNTEKILLAGSTELNGLRVITRNQWGADETLRYYDPKEYPDSDSGSSSSSKLSSKVIACNAKIKAYPDEYKYAKVIAMEGKNHLKWSLQYSPSVKKIIVHHTGETNITNNRPSDEMMRAIYYYHTIVRGWGDIGYHYVIGKDGEIFEGKKGGDKVVGAHVYCNNIGTVGVSVMGNFQISTVSTKQINSLKTLLSKLTKKYNLKPNGTSTFHGKNIPNIIGHRDLAATACPGKNLYSLLAQIRQDVSRGFTYKFEDTTSKKEYDAEVTKKISVLKLNPTHQETVTFKFKNTGTQTWNENTWLHIALNKNTNAWADSIVPDKVYVAADMQEKEVKPGKTGNFKVTINAGYNPGFYILEFAPVVNNKYKLSKSAILQPIEIEEPKYSYKFIKAHHPPNPFYTEQSSEAWIELKNTGNIIWRNYGDNKIYLGTQKPQDRKSFFSPDGRRTRLGYLQQREIKPGEIGRFVMPLTAPTRRGIFKESFAPVIEGIKWLEDKGMYFRIVVKKPQHKIEFINKFTTFNLNPDTTKTVNIKYKNLSDINWEQDEVYFKLAGDYQKLGITENTIQLDSTLKKNSQGSFKLVFQTPMNRGFYRISIVPSIRGKKFSNASPLNLRIIVKRPNARGEITNKVITPVRLDTNQSKTITIQIKNRSNFTWKNNHNQHVSLITTNQKNRLYVKDKWISKTVVSYMQENSVTPGKTATFQLYLKPKYRGYYSDIFRVKIDNIGFVKDITIPLRVIVAMDKTAKSNVQNISKTISATSTKTTTQTVASQTQDNPIRIKLSMPESGLTTLTANENYSILDSNQKTLFNVSKNQKTYVKKIGNYLHIQTGSTNKVSSELVRFVPNNNGIMEITNWEHRPAWNNNLNDNRFRNIIEIRIIDNSLTIINELPLENYLKGIAEVSNSDPVEKLKTMAVIARSYAKFYLQPENEKFPGKPYDGSDDPNVFQKYLGYGLELRSPNFTQAVEITKNEVVTYQEKLVKTPYFNQSNGRTLSAQEVWGWNHTPYLISVEDTYCQGLSRKGHGVGLSGYGATQMAKNGKSYKNIIKYYYQGVEIDD